MTGIVDYFSLWRADRLADPSRRSRQEEQAFWHGHAAIYDERAGLASASLAQVGAVISRIRPGWSVLDIGAGTGRFTLPLAQRGCQLSVVDRSVDMLDQLRAKLDSQRGYSQPVELICAEWPLTWQRRFDAVIAAWSLYWNLDLRASLEAICAAAKKYIVIIDTTGTPSVYEKACAYARSGSDKAEPGQARHLLFAGGLAQLGISADITIVTDFRRITSQILHHDLAGDEKLIAAAISYLDDHCPSCDQYWYVPRKIGVVSADLEF